MKKLISVIVPCYNSEKYIDRCINSLVHQTIGIDNLELILVNDASSDGTIAHLRKWESMYPDSIVIIDCKDNHRTGGARNIGIRNAGAKYIGFVDNDDEIEYDMYELLFNAAKTYECDVVSCLYERVSPDGKVFPLDMPQGEKNVLVDKTKEIKQGVSELPGEVWNKLFLKKLIIDNKLFFPENLCYSENCWGQLLLYYIKRYYVVDKVLYHHIVNFDSILMSNSVDMHRDRLQVEIIKLNELKRRKLCDINSEEVEFGFLLGYYINTLHLFFSRTTELETDTIRNMQKEVLDRYPNYMYNKKVRNVFPDYTQVYIIATIDENLSEEQWEAVKQSYNNEEYDYGIFLDDNKRMRFFSMLVWHFYKDLIESWNDMTDMMLGYAVRIYDKIKLDNSDSDNNTNMIEAYYELVLEDKKLEDVMGETIYEWSFNKNEVFEIYNNELISDENKFKDIINCMNRRKNIYCQLKNYSCL